MSAVPLLDLRGLTIALDGIEQPLVDGVSFIPLAGRDAVHRRRKRLRQEPDVAGADGPAANATAARDPPARRDWPAIDLLAMSTAQLRTTRGGRMAMIFQEPMTSLNPALRIGDQIAEAVRRHKGVTHAKARARRSRCCAGYASLHPNSGSTSFRTSCRGAMRQRAMIAMALANDPELLIADPSRPRRST